MSNDIAETRKQVICVNNKLNSAQDSESTKKSRKY